MGLPHMLIEMQLFAIRLAVVACMFTLTQNGAKTHHWWSLRLDEVYNPPSADAKETFFELYGAISKLQNAQVDGLFSCRLRF